MAKKLIVSLVVCFSITSLSTGMVAAKGRGGKDLDDKIFKKMYIALENKDEIGLSDSQVDEILNLKVETKKDRIMKKAEIKNTILDLKLQLMKDNIDMRKVNSLIDKKYSLKNQKAKSLIQAYVDLKDILSEKQMDKLKELCKKKCSEYHRKHKGGRMMEKKHEGYMSHMKGKEHMMKEKEYMMKEEHMGGMHQ